MNEIVINKTKFKLESSWQELKASRLSKVIFLLIVETGNELERKLKALQQLGKLKKIDLEKITPFQMLSVLDCIDWMFTTYPEQPTYKSFRVGKKFIAPSARLSNSVFVEFAFADEYLQKYLETKDVQFLNKLIACIYRPKKSFIQQLINPSSDKRQKFNEEDIERNSKLISYLPDEIRFSIFLFYIGCRKYLVKTFAAVFQSDYSEDESLPVDLRERLRKQKEEQSKNEINFGWIGLINNLSKSGQYGDYEKTKYTNLHTVLYNLCIDIIQAKKKENENS